MSSSDSELNSDSSDAFSDEDRPFLAMLSSSSSEHDEESHSSSESDDNMFKSSDEDDVPLDARLERRVV